MPFISTIAQPWVMLSINLHNKKYKNVYLPLEYTWLVNILIC